MCDKFKFLILLTLSAPILGCIKVDIICDKLERNYWDEPEGAQVGIGFLTTCQVRSLNVSMTSDDSSEVNSIVHKNGSLIENSESDQIGALTLQNVKFSHIPKRISNFLANLKVAQFSNNGLLSVTKEDLKQFGSKLELIDFSFNNLTAIEADLFEFNPQLKAVIFRRNPIKLIHPGFFDSLVNLRQLLYAVLRSGCINVTFYSKNHDDIENFNWKNSKCFNSTERPVVVRPRNNLKDC